ncbi:MAG: DNA recombination protein RmuC [bacterium]
MTLETTAIMLVIAGVGSAIGYLVALLVRAAQMRQLAEERAGARQEADRVPGLEGRILELTRENSGLLARIAETSQAAEAERDKNLWLTRAEEKLREAFQALAAEALKGNTEQFAGRAREQLLVPMEKSLKALDEHVRELEQKREGAYRSLDEHLGQLKDAYNQLRSTTSSLSTALTTSSGARGEWGEVQMRRIVELAGMVRHVDFDEQERTEAGKPDMIVRLPNEGIIAVDAKTTMKTYLDAIEVQDTTRRKAGLQAHATAVRGRVRELAGKEYWKQYERAPDFIIMFVPHEAFLSAALEGDRDLLDYAFNQRVLLATPVTLLALLKTVSYAWQQQKLTENTREIANEAHELCDRLFVFIGHLNKTGRSLDSAVKSYNDSIGSLQSRVIPCARRLKELGATGSEVPAVEPVGHQVTLPVVEE